MVSRATLRARWAPTRRSNERLQIGAGTRTRGLRAPRWTRHSNSRRSCIVARLSENSERLYESDNCVLGDLTGARQRAEAERLKPK